MIDAGAKHEARPVGTEGSSLTTGGGIITIEDVLGLAILQRGSPVVCAGADQLDRAVRWVHISDLPTPAPSLRGGELLLTHGVGLRHGQKAQQQFIEALADLPIAGVVLELGRVFREPPAAMVKAAERVGLPLISLKRRIMFIEVTEQVHGMILQRHESRVAEAQRLGAELVDLAAAGATIRVLLRRLAVGVGKPIVLEDAAHQLVESAGYEPSGPDPVAEWAEHSRAEHRGIGEDPLESPSEVASCCLVAVRLRNEVWGRLHALGVDEDARSATSVALQHAGSALAIALLLDRPLIGVGRYGSGSFVEELVARRLSRSQILERSRHLGADLSAAVVGGAVGLADSGEQEVVARRAQHEQVCELIKQGLRRAGVSCIWRADERRGLLCIGAADATAIGDGVKRATELLEQAGIIGDVHGICLGLSEVTTAEFLADALDHAREAAGLGGEEGVTTVRWYDDLGLDRLFLRLAEGPDLAAYVESELGRLLAYDAENSSPLLPVLEAYLRAGGSKSEAARDLFIGRRSLYYKLEVIGNLVTRDLEDPGDRTALAVALSGLTVLRRRGLHSRLTSR